MNDKPFTERREEIANRVAKTVHERRQKLRNRFGERKYGQNKPSPDERKALWGDLRLDTQTLPEEYKAAIAEMGIGPGLLPRRFIEEAMGYEAEHAKKAQVK